MSPALRDPAAPRLRGLATAEGGGAACRTACAQQQYFCASADEADRCTSAWSQCVAACPLQSDDPL